MIQVYKVITQFEKDGTFDKMISGKAFNWLERDDKKQYAIQHVLKSVDKFKEDYTLEQNVGYFFKEGINRYNQRDKRLAARQIYIDAIPSYDVEMEQVDHNLDLTAFEDCHPNVMKFLLELSENPTRLGSLKKKYSLGRGNVETFEEILNIAKENL